MTGLERIQRLGRDLWDIFKPTDGTSLLALVVLVLMVIVAIIMRKEWGGFFRGFFRMLWQLILLGLLYAIHPLVMVGVLVLAVIGIFCGKKGIPFTRVLIGIAIVGAVALAFYSTFMVWRKSDHFLCYINFFYIRMSNYRKILRWVFLAFMEYVKI